MSIWPFSWLSKLRAGMKEAVRLRDVEAALIGEFHTSLADDPLTHTQLNEAIECLDQITVNIKKGDTKGLNKMKRTLDWLCFGLLLCAILMLSGCTVLDWLFVPNKGQNPNETPGAILGTIINYIIPGAGALVATAGAVYGKLRGSAAIKEREAHEATLGAIKEATAGGGAVDAAGLDNIVKSYHKEAGTELIHENIQAALEAST